MPRLLLYLPCDPDGRDYDEYTLTQLDNVRPNYWEVTLRQCRWFQDEPVIHQFRGKLSEVQGVLEAWQKHNRAGYPTRFRVE